MKISLAFVIARLMPSPSFEKKSRLLMEGLDTRLDVTTFPVLAKICKIFMHAF